MTGLTEKTRGIFYLKSRACLHFHEDPTGLYADIRLSSDDFHRLRVDTPDEQAVLIQWIKDARL